MRANLLAAWGRCSNGACRITAAAWSVGDRLGSAVVAATQQVHGWWTVWHGADAETKQKVRTHWGRTWMDLALRDASDIWRGVKGVMGATILTLLQDLCTPYRLDRWVTPDKSKRAELGSGEPYLLHELLKEIKRHATAS